MSYWVIVVAAGEGSRFGGPKQFASLGDESVLVRSVRLAASGADGVVVVAASALVDRTRAELVSVGDYIVVPGGATRAASVRNGLAAVPAEAAVIVVHDAVRPFATEALYQSVVGAITAGADAAVPGVAVVDTLRRRSGGTVDRDALVAVQTPQAFRADALRAAHRGGPEATDDAGLVEAAGGSVVIVEGLSANLKITTPTDLVVARALLDAVEAP